LHLCFFLSPSSPFRLDLTVWGIRCRPENLVDQVGWQDLLARIGYLRQTGAHECYTIMGRECATARGHRLCRLPPHSRQERGDHRPRAVVGARGRLHELASRYRGLKPPRFPTVWEGLVNGIACQQFSPDCGDSPAEPPSSALWIAVWEGRSTARVPHAERSVGGRAEVSPTPRLQRGEDPRADRIGEGNCLRGIGSRSVTNLDRARRYPGSWIRWVWEDGPPNMSFSVAWAVSIFFQAMISERATIWRDGCTCADRSIMAESCALSTNGSRTEG
jgi:hypothetical protein